MESKYCQFTEFVECRSAITGRLVRVNGALDKFFLPTKSYRYARSLACKMWHWEQKNIPTSVKPLLDAFLSVRSDQQFAQAIDALMEELIRRETVPQHKTEGVNWLIRLWVGGVIGLPVNWPLSTLVRFMPDDFCCGVDSWVLQFLEVSRSVVAKGTAATQMLLRIAGPTQGIQEPGDVTPTTVSSTAIKANRLRLSGLVTPLLIAQRQQYGELDALLVDGWGLGKKGRGYDRDYFWVLEKDSTLAVWREQVSDWVNDRKAGFSTRTLVADRFFAYLIDYPHLPRTVEEYCRREMLAAPSWIEWLGDENVEDTRVRQCGNTMAEFFDWYLAKALTGEDDFGRPVASPLHHNPITRVRQAGSRIETSRDALPLRYIHDLIKIIIEDDFAWPKTLRADYFPYYEVDSGVHEKRWSPVRAYALLVKLYLPLRTYQVRMLDSGEADTERYVNGQWAANENPLAKTGTKVVRKGFLRKFRDTRNHREFTGFFINTNKTADLYRDERDRGYDVPWQHNEVVALATALRDWQERFNPIKAPTRWETLHDKSVLKIHSLQALQTREPVCFLFRDPCELHPNEPVRGDRMQTFWAALVSELERRLESNNRRLPDGSPIRLVERRNKSGYVRPVYDLHSLRVSLITAYATEGGVPIHILSKCIAGHATILMTLYYNKPGPAYVTEKMVEAQAKLAVREQENFVRYLQNEEYRNAAPLVLAGEAGVTMLGATSPVSWVVGDIGLCPASGMRCQEGGEPVGRRSAKPVYGPVPGGPKNCVRCRFFVTGPAFLGGLVAQFNAVGLALSDAADTLRRVETEIYMIEDGNTLDMAQQKIGLLYERRDRLMEEVDQIAMSWHALYSFIERCKHALSEGGGNGMSLVLAGAATDLEIALTDCSHVELLDSVCQAGVVYPNKLVESACLRRGRLLDAMLIRNGRTPVFATLSEQEMLAVGNEMVAFLMSRCGRVDTVDLIEGRRMLESAGITKDLDNILAGMSPLHGMTGMRSKRKLYDK